MAMHKIKKGLNLPIGGLPKQQISDVRGAEHVALVAADYVGMRPRMHVQVGDTVRRGQLLFEDRKTAGVRFTAPAAGKVSAINRGAKRALQSVVLAVDEASDEQAEQVSFSAFSGEDVSSQSADAIRALLVESGLWTALRARPFGRVPSPEGDPPHAIFVTAIDTNPLAPDIAKVIENRQEDFQRGLRGIAKLSAGKTYVCCGENWQLPQTDIPNVVTERFGGVHPAGNVGLHIHLLDPRAKGSRRLAYRCPRCDRCRCAFSQRTVGYAPLWSPSGGRRSVSRVCCALVWEPVSMNFAQASWGDGDNRVISGSVLSGRAASGEVHGYLGRYSQQVSVIREDRSQKFLGWLSPGANKFSTIPIMLSKLLGRSKFAMTSTTHGSPRAIVPIGMYERCDADGHSAHLSIARLGFRGHRERRASGCPRAR